MTSVEPIIRDAVAVGGVPGIVVALRDGTESTFLAAGVSNLATEAVRTQQQCFRIGSLTKSFTATVLLQLVAERRLTLEDSVDRWLPGLLNGHGQDGASITVEHLLRQTSGISNYSLDPRMLADFFCPRYLVSRFDRYLPEQLVDIAITHQPDFAPGTGWRYSNTNYVLAGMVIEAVSGMSFGDNVVRRICQPLELTHTFVPHLETQMPEPHCLLYSRGADGTIYDVTDQDTSSSWAAGGMVSTTTDLSTFSTALLRGSLLPVELTRRMFSTVATDDGGWIPNTRYGLGVFTQKLPGGADVWGGGGAVSGSWSYCMGSRDGARVMVIHVNGDWTDGPWATPIDLFTELLAAAFAD